MIRSYARRHPRTTAFVVFAAFASIIVLPYVIVGAVDGTQGSGVLNFKTMAAGFELQAVMAVAVLVLVWLLKWSDITGLRGPLDRAGLRSTYWLAAYPVIAALSFCVALLTSDSINDPLTIIALVFSLNIFVGITEEVLFRGFIFGALRQKHQLFTAITFSSLAFGALHLANLGVGQAVSLTMFQVINATALGALFCAIRLQTNSLWPPILLHMIWNAFVMLGQSLLETVVDQSGETISQDTLLRLTDFWLPLFLIFLTAWVLRNYVRRTGQSLFNIRPINPLGHSVGV